MANSDFAEKELLASERRGRALAAREAPRPGDVWRLAIASGPDASALTAAARWASRLGARVETRTGSANRLTICGIGGKKDIVDIPDPEAAWSLPLTKAGAFVAPMAARSPVLTAAQCRAVDALAMERFGIPGLCLMENAAIDAVILARDMMPTTDAPTVLAAVGGGNNGGDGLAAARGLAQLGATVSVALLKDPASLSGDAGVNLRLLEDCRGATIHDVHADPEQLRTLTDGRRLLIDALLGTGFKGRLSPAYATAIQTLNSTGIPILALDLPSGLDADAGSAGGPVIRAACTLAFAAIKPSLLRDLGPIAAGQIYLGDIGAPNGAFAGDS